MSDVTILHNAHCSTSRHAVEQAGEDHVSVDIIQYLQRPLSKAELVDLIGKLEDPPADLVRKDAHFKELGLTAEDYQTPEQVAELLAREPRLMQRPVLVRGDRAIIGRPQERADAFLAETR